MESDIMDEYMKRIMWWTTTFEGYKYNPSSPAELMAADAALRKALRRGHQHGRRLTP